MVPQAVGIPRFNGFGAATDPPRRVHQEVQAMDLLVQGLAVHLIHVHQSTDGAALGLKFGH